MGKTELNPKILEKLKKKTGIKEQSIRSALTKIRRGKPHLTLNAAAHIFAEKKRFSVLRYLSDIDRDSLKNIQSESSKVPSSKPIQKKKIIEIAIYNTNDKLLNAHLKEINKTYTHACYTACFVLCRKVLENLLIHKILRKKYPNNNKNHREKYYDFNRGRYLDFEKIIKNLKSCSKDFGPEKDLVERICQLARRFKDSANVMTHSFYHIASKREIDDNNFQNLLDMINTLENLI